MLKSNMDRSLKICSLEEGGHATRHNELHDLGSWQCGYVVVSDFMETFSFSSRAVLSGQENFHLSGQRAFGWNSRVQKPLASLVLMLAAIPGLERGQQTRLFLFAECPHHGLNDQVLLL